MYPFAVSYILLARRNPMEDLSDYFRGPRVQLSTNDAVLMLVVLGGLILFMWLLSVLMNWQEQGQRRPSSLRLFLVLSRAHQLAWTDVWLLWRLARSQRLSDPARVFLEPERFERVHLSGTLRRSADRLAELRQKLFAHPADGPPDDGRDPTWQLPAEQRQGTPLAPVTPTPRLSL